MGARRLPASRRHGTHDGIASSCTDARAACACPLPRARPVSLSRPKCWQHGVVRHVEPSWDQGARAESARNGHSRPRTGTAVARARGGPPASPPRLRGVARVDLCYRERKCVESCNLVRSCGGRLIRLGFPPVRFQRSRFRFNLFTTTGDELCAFVSATRIARARLWPVLCVAWGLRFVDPDMIL